MRGKAAYVKKIRLGHAALTRATTLQVARESSQVSKAASAARAEAEQLGMARELVRFERLAARWRAQPVETRAGR